MAGGSGDGGATTPEQDGSIAGQSTANRRNIYLKKIAKKKKKKKNSKSNKV